MPTYDYLCTKCKHRFELFHSMSDDAPKRCPKCKAKARRVPGGGAGLLFKGSGFYITDYRSRSYKEKAKQESGSSGSSGSGSGGSATPSSGSSGSGEKKPSKGKRDSGGS